MPRFPAGNITNVQHLSSNRRNSGSNCSAVSTRLALAKYAFLRRFTRNKPKKAPTTMA